MGCKISGKKINHHVFVVAFDMQKTRKAPARGERGLWLLLLGNN